MSKLDVCIIIMYFVTLLLIGFIANKKQKNMDDYYVAGRNRGSFSIMCLWLCGWVGGSSIIGTSQLSHDIGIGGGIVSLAVVIGLVVFALTTSKKINIMGGKYKHLTYPDLIEARYDKRSSFIATITTVLSYIAFIASQFVAGGNVLSSLTGWDIGISYVVCVIVIILYTSMGGYLAVTFTDWLQFSLIIIGVVFVTFPFTYNAIPFGELKAAVPETMWDLGQYGSVSTILGMVVATILCFYTSMDSYTRMYSAKSPKAAKTGTLLCAVFITLIMIATVYIGIASNVLLPDMQNSAQTMTLIMTKLLPGGFRGLLIIGILSAIMSTADISILTGSSNLTNDIYHKYIKKDASDKHLLMMAMLFSLGIGILGACLAWYKQDIIEIIYIAFTISSANLFIPTVCGMVWKKGTASASFYSMLISLITVLVWYIVSDLGCKNVIFTLDPIWPGLVVSAVIYIIISILDNPDETEKKKTEQFMQI